VDVFLPIAGEPLEVLRNTWTGIAKAIWAYPGIAIAYVLDDGASPQARELARQFGFRYAVRPDRPRMRKSGNLRYAYAHTSGELIAIFDADFTPRADYFLETVPYFDDPYLGILQTPQFFRSDHRQTWVERAGNVVQEIFYRNIQSARDALRGSSVCCGTCAIYRRNAMRPNGGFAEVPYAEDEHTGLNVRDNGYDVRYIPVALAAGMSPGTVDGFVRQQYRWTSGTFSTMRRWPRDKGLRVWVAYASGLFYYLYSAAMVAAGPVVPIAMLAFWPGHVHLYNYFALAPALISGFILYPLWHREEFGPAAWPLALIRGWAHLLAIVDYVTGNTMQWQATGGGASPVKRLWAGVVIWNGGTAAAWVSLAIYRTVQTGSDRFGLIGLLGLFYAALTVFVVASDNNSVRRAVLRARALLARREP
jgi:cellulose synthase (UDP-forming)